MEVDLVDPTTATSRDAEASAAETAVKTEPPKAPKIVTFDAKPAEKKPPLDLDTLYPIFWNLQASFSRPTRLFDSETFSMFKQGLEATLTCFHDRTSDASNSLKVADDARRGMKRKRGENGQEMPTGFNPKYLTNRDLFYLENKDVTSAEDQRQTRWVSQQVRHIRPFFER